MCNVDTVDSVDATTASEIVTDETGRMWETIKVKLDTGAID